MGIIINDFFFSKIVGDWGMEPMGEGGREGKQTEGMSRHIRVMGSLESRLKRGLRKARGIGGI